MLKQLDKALKNFGLLDVLLLQALKVVEKEAGSVSLGVGDTVTLKAIDEFDTKPHIKDKKKQLPKIVQAFNDHHWTDISEADTIRFKQMNGDIADEDMTETLHDNPPDIDYATYHYVLFQDTIRMLKRDNKIKSIVLADAGARDKAKLHFFNRTLRKA